MKLKLLLFSLMFLPIVAAAQKVNEQQALQIAQQFMKGKTFASPAKVRGTDETASIYEPLYVFNDQEGEGFVIVSGDERAQTILAYSDSGTFDYDNLPENTKAWIDGYAEQIKSIDSQEGVAKARATSPKLTKEVAPLLGNIAWNQMDPYNRLCPTNGTQPYLTGCGPTAMAQIMYYHRWPQGYGKGSISYYDEGCHQTHSADFSKSKYDWDKMLPVYYGHHVYQDGKSVWIEDFTDEQANEVAKLMRDCGFAARANYDGDGTSSSGGYICEALEKNFDYKQTTCLLESSYYDKESWESIIRNELDNKRPVLYEAITDQGGHLFICDGYDKNGLFHINWGWGGSKNGYYATGALRDCDRGKIWCGIQRSIDTGKQIISPHAGADFKWTSGNQFSCGLRVWTSVNNVELAIAAENLVTRTIQYFSITPYGEQYDTTPWVYQLTLNGTPADGNYKLYPVARASGQDWEKFHFYQFANYQEYVLLTVSGGAKTFSNDVDREKYLYNDIWYSLDKTTHEAKATRFVGGSINGRYTASSLTISSSLVYNGETYTVTAIDEDAFSRCTFLTSITIPSSVKEIGPSAFLGCTSLAHISLKGNVTTVGPWAFYGCTSLASVNFGDNIKSIGHYAFSKCTSLTSAKLPSGLTSIEEYTFYNCSSLAEVVIPASVTSIGEFALYTSSNNLRVKSLIMNPFSYEYQAIYPQVTLIVPDGTKEKYKETPYWSSFSTIMEESGLKIGETFRVVEEDKYIDVKVTDTDPRTVEIQSVLGRTNMYLPGKVVLPTSVKGPDDKTYTITAIGKSGMYGREKKWTSIVIPNTVTTIGNTAFSSSPTLKDITIPASVTSIGESAFATCTALESVTVKAETPICIPESTFKNTPSLTTLYVPKGSEMAYRNAPVWKDIKNIIGIDMAALGDINEDGEVDVTDVVELIDMVLAGSNDPAGDINGDGEVDVTDIVELIDIVLGN